MKKLLFTLLLSFVVLFAFGQGMSKIDAELYEEIALKGSNELIRINVIMTEQYDQFEMRQKSDFYNTKEAKRTFVVNELKNFSKSTQSEVSDLLFVYSKSGKASNVQSFWIYNGITCYANAEVIEELASRQDVMMIGFDREQNMIPQGETAKEVENLREVTANILKVNADDVWELGYRGEGVIVAVVDTGVNYNHLDLADHLWTSDEYPNHGYDFYNNDNNPMDDMGHGSHCAGTIAGDGTAGSSCGAAPDATVMCVKVLSSDGNGSISQICNGVQFAVEQGAHIFSMSLGFYGGGTNSERVQFRNTMINALEAGVVGAVAAGNEGSSVGNLINVRVPGNCPPPWLHPDQTVTGDITCVVCVGAVNNNDNAAYFTSIGPVTWQSVDPFNDYAYPPVGLIRPDVCAPGVDIKSLNYATNNGYTTMSGTSMATPCVAGVMALLMSKNIDLTPAEIDEILETSAVPLSASKSNTFGSGRIDAAAAIELVVTGPVLYNSHVINDAEGNNDGKINPGETVSFTISMENVAEYAVSNVEVTLSTDNEYVTITDAEENFGNFASGEIKTVENAYTVTVSADAPGTQTLKFNLSANSGDEVCVSHFSVVVYDYNLEFQNIMIMDVAGNNNGILDPGETANMRITIANNGNETAYNLSAILSTASNLLTINSNSGSYGDLAGDGATAYVDFSVSLSNAAVPGDIHIPLSMLVSDEDNRITSLSFVYSSVCNIVFDLHDSFGDGWNGAAIIASFSDGSPSQTFTISNGSSASYSLEVSGGVTINLTWQSGSWDTECSFEIYYEEGDMIYEGGAPGSGVFHTFNADCGGEIVVCDPVQNLAATSDNDVVTVSWDEPATGTPEYYSVFLNSEFVENTTSTTFVNENTAVGNNEFCVQAFYTDCISGLQCVNVFVELVCDPVSNISHVLYNEGNVTFTWNAPENNEGLEEYEILIDAEITVSTGTETTLSYQFTEGQHNIAIVAKYDNTCESTPVSYDFYVVICEPVVNLAQTVDFQGGFYTVSLSWEAQGATLPSSYEIYLGDELLETTDELLYSATVEPGTYNYCVVALYNSQEPAYNCSSNQVCVEVVVPDYVCDPVEDFTGIQEAKNVLLDWKTPANYVSKGLDGYNVYIDEVLVSETTETEFVVTEAPLGSHVYGVTAKYSYACSESEMSTVIIDITAINNYNKIAVYPNPANDYIKIEGDNVIAVTVYNAVGQTVVSVNNDYVNVSDFVEGVYMLHIQLADGSVYKTKVVISR
ncbi:MAG: S8 family serine peptidase [Bacteroidales bacterium]|nr:S8 family serine peptidase [Bacteroidales bacterium]MDD3151277.1 S8 family serine peptidase [Bacteroidales bacterium]MDD3914241.1 S8 family serine peptidase [Bacteroidales bacterium]MDD4633443.1 S8 family serine peptidase [Bacteroidales bacterium]